MGDVGALPNIPLSMEELAKIGATAVYEARAKANIALMLKPMESLDCEAWLKLEKSQLKQLVKRVVVAVKNVDDQCLKDLVQSLVRQSETAQDLRHIVVHAEWAYGADHKTTAFDNRREKWLSSADIEVAFRENAILCGLAHHCVFRVVELVDQGCLQRGTESNGPCMRLATGLVKL